MPLIKKRMRPPAMLTDGRNSRLESFLEKVASEIDRRAI
jgi:hypothetical protein